MKLKVAVAIIFDEQNRVLITQRSMQVDHAGLWEFPGGKLEEDELPASALVREIKEEVGIDALSYSFLGEVVHHYETKTVQLLIYVIDDYQGEARCCESQLALRWVSPKELGNFAFPAANFRVIELVLRLVEPQITK